MSRVQEITMTLERMNMDIVLNELMKTNLVEEDDDDKDKKAYWDEFNDCYEEEYEEEFTPSDGYYRTGNGDMVYAFAGESEDLTACDSECGMCGRCSY